MSRGRLRPGSTALSHNGVCVRELQTDNSSPPADSLTSDALRALEVAACVCIVVRVCLCVYVCACVR